MTTYPHIHYDVIISAQIGTLFSLLHVFQSPSPSFQVGGLLSIGMVKHSHQVGLFSFSVVTSFLLAVSCHCSTETSFHIFHLRFPIFPQI